MTTSDKPFETPANAANVQDPGTWMLLRDWMVTVDSSNLSLAIEESLAALESAQAKFSSEHSLSSGNGRR